MRALVPLADRKLTCCDCGAMFVFAAQEQHSFRERWTDPIRCSACRRTGYAAEKRRERERITKTNRDVPRSCLGCGATFIVEAHELQFLLERFGDDAVMPRRCPSCRYARRTAAALQY